MVAMKKIKQNSNFYVEDSALYYKDGTLLQGDIDSLFSSLAFYENGAMFSYHDDSDFCIYKFFNNEGKKIVDQRSHEFNYKEGYKKLCHLKDIYEMKVTETGVYCSTSQESNFYYLNGIVTAIDIDNEM